MFPRFRCCECYRVQKSSLSQQVLSKIEAEINHGEKLKSHRLMAICTISTICNLAFALYVLNML